MEELREILGDLIQLLKEEKKALIQNDGNRVREIVLEKERYIDRISEFKAMDIEEDRGFMGLIEEINSLQELNLLLTNQALSYQNSILESILNNANGVANTYSANGNYAKESNINLIDQSV